MTCGNVIRDGGDLHYDARKGDGAFDPTPFNRVSAQQPSRNFRYFSSQFDNIRVDAANNLNGSVLKDFVLHETVKLQFRADSFNLCNHALFAAPNVTPHQRPVQRDHRHYEHAAHYPRALRLIF